MIDDAKSFKSFIIFFKYEASITPYFLDIK